MPANQLEDLQKKVLCKNAKSCNRKREANSPLGITEHPFILNCWSGKKSP